MIQLERLGIKMGPRADEFGSFARFNPGCIRVGDEVCLLYRSAECSLSETERYVTAIGFARLNLDGGLRYDSNRRVLYPSLPEEARGCEDPRIVPFEGRVYVFYTAYDGRRARVAVARTEDFERFEKLGVIHNGFFDKDAFLFPQRVGGKLAYLHRVGADIQLSRFDSVEDLLSSPRWERYADYVDQETILRADAATQKKIGGGAPPILTRAGWLLIYHSVDQRDVYRGEAALLDREDPSRVIAALPYPILEPREEYELHGDVDNVTFPQGTYQRDGDLYVYYGAADKYIALAKVNLENLLDELLRHA